MAITVSDLRFYQSERMTDNDDGGGRMTAVEITSGTENGVFDDLSDVDRAAGDVSIRKIYAAVTNPEADKYLDAGVVIMRPPADPNVSVLAFSTGDFYDERTDLKNTLESGISVSSAYTGWLWGQHIPGQRAVLIWQRLSAPLPPVGGRLYLRAMSGTAILHGEYVWITRIVESLVERADDKGVYQVRSLVCEIAEPLKNAYAGLEPQRQDPSAPPTLLYNTRYTADFLALCGVSPLKTQANVGDYSVQVEDIYAPLIPTAFAETALADTTPSADNTQMIAAAGEPVTFTTTLQVVKPGVNLFLGTGCQPGTLSIDIGGAILTDLGGKVMLAGNQVGTIDYGNGVCTWMDACPNYGTSSKVVSFTPAAQAVRISDTATQVVTLSNRGFVWVQTLLPIPSPGSTRVAYRANNNWYVLTDDGSGALRGVDSSYGSGQVNFTTGTVTVTTGALPDVDSEVMFFWGTDVNYSVKAGIAVQPPRVTGQTANTGITPGSVSVTWRLDGVTKTLTDSGLDGYLTDPLDPDADTGYGYIRYLTGEWWVQPGIIPAVGTEFTIDYEYGPPQEETFTTPARNVDGDLELTLANLPREGTIVLTYNVAVQEYNTSIRHEYSWLPKAGGDDPNKPNWWEPDGFSACVRKWFNQQWVGSLMQYTPANINLARRSCGEID